jgi:hypothetical protein
VDLEDEAAAEIHGPRPANPPLAFSPTMWTETASVHVEKISLA